MGSAWPWEPVVSVQWGGDRVSGEGTWCSESVAGESCEGEDGVIHCCGHCNVAWEFFFGKERLENDCAVGAGFDKE